MDNRNNVLLFVVVWVVLGIASGIVFHWAGYVRFNTDDIGSMLIGYSVLAVIIEQFVGIFLADENRRLSLSFKKENVIREKLRHAGLNDNQELMNQSNGELVTCQEEIVRIKSEKEPTFIFWSLIAGIVTASLGFRFFAQVVEPTNFPQDASIPNAVIYVADIVLTGTLLSGGAKFVDSILELLKRIVP